MSASDQYQAAPLASDEARDLDYWLQRLSPVPEASGPLSDYQRGARSNRYERTTFIFDPDVQRGVERVSGKEDFLAHTIALVALAVVVGRYTSSQRVVIGTASLADGTGLPPSALPVVIAIEDDEPFAALLQRVRALLLEDCKHRAAPYEQVLEGLGIDADSGHPLVSTVLVHSRLHQGAPLMSQDLTLELKPGSEGLRCDVLYKPAVYREISIQALLSHWQEVLRSGLSDPNTLIGRLSMCSGEERDRLLHGWNAGFRPVAETTLTQLFEAEARRSPGAAAIVSAGTVMTYRQLDESANRVARQLGAMGVGTGDAVGVAMPRCAELFVALLGILKAGAAYLPFDPSTPPERVGFCIKDAQARVVIAVDSTQSLVPSTECACLRMDRDAETIRARSGASLPVRARPTDLAYLIYTSGSTGEPKGVMTEHRAVASYLAAVRDSYRIDVGDRVLQSCPVSFDMSIEEIFPCLTGGGALVLRTDDMLDSVERFLSLCGEWKVSVLSMATAYWHEMVALLENRPEALPSALRLVIFGTERVLPERVRQWQRSVGGRVQLFHTYGPTEATVLATSYEVPAHGDEMGILREVPIGKPISNARIYLLDEQSEPVPVGVPGEICIGGNGLARGYLHRAEMTAAKFIEGNLTSDAWKRLYRTGDLARYLPDGNLEFLGRVDRQVKIRGYRVELGEIESAIDSCEGVSQAVVAVRKDRTDNQALAAYLVPDVAASATAEVRQQLESTHLDAVRQHFDRLYERAEREHRAIGFSDGVTGTPLDASELETWERLQRARMQLLPGQRILDLGCGSDSVALREMGPGALSYVGCDFSERAALAARERITALAHSARDARIIQASALDGVGLGRGPDTVVLGAVAGSFPSVHYLRDVLNKAIDSMEEGGCIYLSAIRAWSLARAFCLEQLLARQDHSITCGDARRELTRAITNEQELLIDPEFFRDFGAAHPRVSSLQIAVGDYGGETELSRYRYDVVIRVGRRASEAPALPVLDCAQEGLDQDRLRYTIARGRPDAIAFSNIPNALLANTVELLSCVDREAEARPVASLRELLARQRTELMRPAVLVETARACGYDAVVRPSLDWSLGRYDAVLRRADQTGTIGTIGSIPLHGEAAKSAVVTTNSPMLQAFGQRLLPTVKSELKRRMPSYMVPSSFSVLSSLPTNANGKLDRSALPVPVLGAKAGASPSLSGMTSTERALAKIWSAALEVEAVGAEDAFLELGGHSLVAIGVLAEIREQLGVDLDLTALYELPLKACAAEIDELASNTGDAGQKRRSLPVLTSAEL